MHFCRAGRSALFQISDITVTTTRPTKTWGAYYSQADQVINEDICRYKKTSHTVNLRSTRLCIGLRLWVSNFIEYRQMCKRLWRLFNDLPKRSKVKINNCIPPCNLKWWQMSSLSWKLYRKELSTEDHILCMQQTRTALVTFENNSRPNDHCAPELGTWKHRRSC